jgi:hypothetical protein
MSGRRREPRYGLSTPRDGALQIRRSVVIERRNERHVYVVSDAPEATGQRWGLESDGAGSGGTLDVRLEECRPFVVGAQTRYRLRFRILNS